MRNIISKFKEINNLSTEYDDVFLDIKNNATNVLIGYDERTLFYKKDDKYFRFVVIEWYNIRDFYSEFYRDYDDYDRIHEVSKDTVITDLMQQASRDNEYIDELKEDINDKNSIIKDFSDANSYELLKAEEFDRYLYLVKALEYYQSQPNFYIQEEHIDHQYMPYGIYFDGAGSKTWKLRDHKKSNKRTQLSEQEAQKYYLDTIKKEIKKIEDKYIR